MLNSKATYKLGSAQGAPNNRKRTMKMTRTAVRKMPTYGSKLVEVGLADLMSGELPRVLPEAQRQISMKGWRAKVGAFDASKVGVIKVVRFNDRLYVADGQHRTMEMYIQGFTHCRAELQDVSSLREAAHVFKGSNTTRPVGRREITAVSIVAEDPMWVAIMETITMSGFKLRTVSDRTQQLEFTTLQCDATLEFLWKKNVLGKVLYLYGSLGKHWAANGNPSSILKAFGTFVLSYPNVKLDDLVHKLRKTDAVKLNTTAFKYQNTGSIAPSTALMWALIDAYNSGRSKERLIKKNSYHL